MSWRETFRLAIESIRAAKIRAGLTMLGMIIGVAAIVLLVSIGNGAKNYITSSFEGLGTNVIIVQPGKTDTKGGMGPPIANSRERMTLADADALKKQATSLEAVSGIVFGTAAVKNKDRTANVNLLGCDEDFNRVLKVKVGAGDFISREESESGRRVAVLGSGVASKLFDTDPAVGQLTKINETEYRVIGVLEKAGDTLGFNIDELVIVPTRAGMRLFNVDKLFGIRAKAKSRVSMADAEAEIREIFMARNNGVDDVTIVTQGSMIDTMNTILDMLTYALSGIAFISLLVGGIGIMNIMLVSVTERTREIGIRRAVGARRSDIQLQFLAESVVLSLIGGGLGMLVSIVITYSVYSFFPKFDMRAPMWILIPAFVLSSAIGILFGVWPARKASHIETIDALRYE